MKKAQAATARAAKNGIEAIAMTAGAPLAAAITVGHRMPMLLGVMQGGHAWSDPEFSRMTTEKLQAASQAAWAVAQAMVAGQQAVFGYAQAQANANIGFCTAPSPTPAGIRAHTERSQQRLLDLTARLGEIGSQGLASGLRPAHRKVTANAKRLSGKK